jgi:hypothetical protein
MDHNCENRERLFEIYTDASAGLGWQNDFLAILDGYAYYKMQYNGREEIIRSKMGIGSKREVLYTVPKDKIVYLMAVTKDGIYLKRYDRESPSEAPGFIPNVKLSLDGKTETHVEIALEEDDSPVFYVGRFDGRLRYIINDKITTIEK